MLKVVKDVEVKTFEAGGGYFVEVTISETEFHGWLYHKDHDVKMGMFGRYRSLMDEYEFLIALEEELEKYKGIYKSLYLDFL